MLYIVKEDDGSKTFRVPQLEQRAAVLRPGAVRPVVLPGPQARQQVRQRRGNALDGMRRVNGRGARIESEYQNNGHPHHCPGGTGDRRPAGLSGAGTLPVSDTLVALRTKVRRRLDENTARFWADEDLNDWINEGAREVARRAEVLQHTSTINAVGGVQQYSLPNDTYRVHRVEWSRDGTQSTTLEYRDFNSMDEVWWSSQRTSRGDPYWFTMWGFPPQLNLIVYPTPDVNIASAFKVFYYRLPGLALADAQVVEIPGGLGRSPARLRRVQRHEKGR